MPLLRRRPAAEEWLRADESSAIPPPKERQTIRDRARRWLLYAVIAAFPVWTIVGVATMVHWSDVAKSAASATSASVVSSPGRAAAWKSLSAWLATTPSPLPGGQIVSWDGSVATDPPESATGTGPTWTSSIESFTLVDNAGNLYLSSVQVALDPRGGSEVVGGPSLIPVAPTADDSWSSDGPWPGLTVVGPPPAVSAAATAWATAYVSGSSGTLRLAIGDTDPTRTYVPLTGATASNVTVISAAVPDAGKPDIMIARVSVALTWGGQDDPAEPMVLDVRVSRADTAAPVVDAWGPPGSGPTLTAYQNAVDVVRRATPTAPTAPASTSVTSTSTTPPMEQ